MTRTGVVTFHELGSRLTRVLLALVEPGGPIEKLARGARHVKRAARGDLHRFKAYVEMADNETGAWRGVIEDGEVVPPSRRARALVRAKARLPRGAPHAGRPATGAPRPAAAAGRTRWPVRGPARSRRHWRGRLRPPCASRAKPERSFEEAPSFRWASAADRSEPRHRRPTRGRPTSPAHARVGAGKARRAAGAP